ncbi:MAG: 23S rRNA (pseudouridine(1915)-N(3))-methyltransferase RlmH [Bdellovibrionales bacterium]|nr:23S rRNA (pseudouridine(1915)-N(3))-methyltransferase RlmH [Bdellovibrionales bacterium]
MEILITATCRTKDKSLLALEEDYLKRFPNENRVKIRELKGEQFLKHSRMEQQRYHSDLIHQLGVPKNRLVLLDELGKEFSTEELTTFLTNQSESGTDRLIFAIGGPCGWSTELKEEASLLFSLSKMTFPYQLARVILIEQLYRCFTIQKNLPYHR